MPDEQAPYYDASKVFQASSVRQLLKHKLEQRPWKDRYRDLRDK